MLLVIQCDSSITHVRCCEFKKQGQCHIESSRQFPLTPHRSWNEKPWNWWHVPRCSDLLSMLAGICVQIGWRIVDRFMRRVGKRPLRKWAWAPNPFVEAQTRSPFVDEPQRDLLDLLQWNNHSWRFLRSLESPAVGLPIIQCRQHVIITGDNERMLIILVNSPLYLRVFSG